MRWVASMREPLSAEVIARMKRDHVPTDAGSCRAETYRDDAEDWPCDAALLLAELERRAPGPVPHLVGIAAGLFGPVDTSELTAKGGT